MFFETTILLQKKHVWKHAILEQLIFPIQLPFSLVLHNNSFKRFHSCKINLPGLFQYFTDCTWNNIFHNYTLITWFFTKVHPAKEGYLTGKGYISKYCVFAFLHQRMRMSLHNSLLCKGSSAHPSDTLQ